MKYYKQYTPQALRASMTEPYHTQVLFRFLYVLAAFVIIMTVTHNSQDGYPPSLGWSPTIKRMVMVMVTQRHPYDDQPFPGE